jgi:membrane-bound lytic murein transglycosylase D
MRVQSRLVWFGCASLAIGVIALVWSTPAHARDRGEKPSDPPSTPELPPVADPPTVEEPPNADVPAVEATDEDLWTWVGRMQNDGETPAVEAAIEEKADEHFAELAIIDQFGNVDVPSDFYADPAKTLKVDPLHLDEVDPSEFDIPVVVNDDVVKWMKYFTGSGRKYYERWLSRSTRYRPIEYAVLEKEGLPRDLVYLSMIESGYNTHAYSVADAAGLWQFIPSTARLYDMRVDYWVDERRDPERASQASAAFLGDLYKMFGDWQLAWASYNAGPGRIKRATSSAGTKDFWTIAHGTYLNPETDNYVPKIMAAAIIGHHPERYGFTDIPFQDELVYETAAVPGSVDLGVLAKCAGISLEEFQEINPALRRWATPPEGYTVRLPVGSKDTFVAALADVPPAERITVAQHRVVRGETLALIARKYDTTAYDIARANHLRDMDVIRVGQTLVIPQAGRGEAVAQAASSSGDTQVAALDQHTASDADPPAPKAKTVTSPRYHTVKSGENLTLIANKYGVEVSQVRSWNGLHGDVIQPGQRLKVGTTTTTTTSATSSSGSSSSGSSSASSSSSHKITVVVKRGDTLSAIATRYGASLADAQRWNHIRNASDIQAGQSLVLYVHDTGWTRYTVQRGDSLGAIATRYHCTVADLRSWNDLDTSVIQPGQVLKVKK